MWSKRGKNHLQLTEYIVIGFSSFVFRCHESSKVIASEREQHIVWESSQLAFLEDTQAFLLLGLLDLSRLANRNRLITTTCSWVKLYQLSEGLSQCLQCVTLYDSILLVIRESHKNSFHSHHKPQLRQYQTIMVHHEKVWGPTFYDPAMRDSWWDM